MHTTASLHICALKKCLVLFLNRHTYFKKKLILKPLPIYSLENINTLKTTDVSVS